MTAPEVAAVLRKDALLRETEDFLKARFARVGRDGVRRWFDDEARTLCETIEASRGAVSGDSQ